MNFLQGDGHGRNLHIGDAVFGLGAAYNGAATLGLRPEDLTLVASENAGFTGEVVTVEPLGREVFYGLATPGRPCPCSGAW